MTRICPVYGQVVGVALIDDHGYLIAIVPSGGELSVTWAVRLLDLIDRHGIADVADTPAGLA